MQLRTVDATYEGDNRFNDKLTIDFTDCYRDSLKRYYDKYESILAGFDKEKLNEQDKLSYDIFKYTLDLSIEELKYPENLIPFNQFSALTLTMGQLGNGTGAQPFKTVADYDNWIKRATAFSAWADSAIVYFRKGIAANYVLPKALVVKMIPQMKELVTSDPTKSVFYGPITSLPKTFSEVDKKRLTAAYIQLIQQQIVPSYSKLGMFLQNEYLPKSRNTAGVAALPDGKNFYAFFVKKQTTTKK